MCDNSVAECMLERYSLIVQLNTKRDVIEEQQQRIDELKFYVQKYAKQLKDLGVDDVSWFHVLGTF